MYLWRASLANSFAILGASIVVVSSSRALAQVPRADELFREGKTLMDQSLVLEACEKFAESVTLVRRAGALLNLAVCREAQGRYATALRLMQEARNMAVADGRTDRVVFVDERLEALRPRLSWLRVTTVGPIPPEDLIVQFDGENLAAGDWGRPRPVDPGPHTIVATAKGQATFHATVVVGPTGDVKEVSIPIMPMAPIGETSVAPAAPPDALDSRPKGPSGWWRGSEWALLGVGISAIGIGSAFGVEAIADAHTSKALCPGGQLHHLGLPG